MTLAVGTAPVRIPGGAFFSKKYNCVRLRPTSANGKEAKDWGGFALLRHGVSGRLAKFVLCCATGRRKLGCQIRLSTGPARSVRPRLARGPASGLFFLVCKYIPQCYGFQKYIHG